MDKTESLKIKSFKTEILKMDKITLQIKCKNHIKWYDIHSVIIYGGESRR